MYNKNNGREGMSALLTRGSFIKTAVASAVGLALGLVKWQPAKAASFDATTVSAVVDFTNSSLDRFTFKGKFNGVSSPPDPNNLKITLALENVTTGEVATWQGVPTQVR
jgi:hypothetical protein